MGVWSAVVETVMSLFTQSAPWVMALKRRALSSSSLGGRRSGGRWYLRRLARSFSSMSRSMPRIGATSKLFRKLPLPTMRVVSPLLRNPRWPRRAVKENERFSPGKRGVSKAKMR